MAWQWPCYLLAVVNYKFTDLPSQTQFFLYHYRMGVTGKRMRGCPPTSPPSIWLGKGHTGAGGPAVGSPFGHEETHNTVRLCRWKYARTLQTFTTAIEQALFEWSLGSSIVHRAGDELAAFRSPGGPGLVTDCNNQVTEMWRCEWGSVDQGKERRQQIGVQGYLE